MTLYSQEPAADAPTGLTGNPARDLARSFNVRVFIFLGLHVPLAMAMELSPWFSTVYGVLALLFGLRAALLGRAAQVLYAVVYISAMEVLWRMSRAYLFWEYAKYAIVLVIFVALITEWSRRGESQRLRSISPILMLASLVPAAVTAVLVLGVERATDALSFNLSSYLALAAMGIYLWGRPVNRNTTIRMLLVLMAPIVGITFLAIYFTLTDIDSLVFLGAANWVTSGNYGPNQVSNMMGFGALAGIMLYLLIPKAFGARVIVLLATIAMLGQGLLTFSRGGIYSFVLATAVFGVHAMNTRRSRRRFLALFALIGILLLTLIYPTLDQFTGGSLTDRFRDLDTTGRLDAALTDVDIFSQNPFVGVGVGVSPQYHATFRGVSLAAHTEFTRLLAEHGLFGILTMGILIWMMANRYFANDRGLGRGMTAAFAVWAMTVMAHSAMRLAAIPVAIALGFILWRVQYKPVDTDAEKSSVALETPPHLR